MPTATGSGRVNSTAQVADNAIETADIKDKNVTLQKMADGTARAMLAYGSGGVIAELPIGSEGEILSVLSGAPSWEPIPTPSTKLAVGGPATIDDGTTAEKTILSFTLPGGTLGTNNAVRIRVNITNFSIDNGTDRDPVFRLKYGTTTVATFTFNQASTNNLDQKGYLEAVLLGNGGTSAQAGWLELNTSLDHLVTDATQVVFIRGNASGTAAEVSTGDLTLALTIQFAAASADCDFVIGGYIAEVIQ